MASYQWIKLYDEILEDPKMGRLSDGAYRFCINLFLLASRQEARDGSLPDLCDIAWILRLDEKTAASHLGELVKGGIVTHEGEKVTVTKFSDRQGKTETAERMKQYRDRKRKTGKDDEPVTPDETEPPRESYDDVTTRNADIDKIRQDKKKDIYSGVASEVTDELPQNQKPQPSETRIQEMIGALSQISKQKYTTEREPEFRPVAVRLIQDGFTVGDVAYYGVWWKKHGVYRHQGKAPLKMILDGIEGVIEQRDNPEQSNGAADNFTQTWQTLRGFMASHGADRKPTLSPEVDALVRKAGGWYQLCMMNQTEAQNRLRSFCNV